MTDDKTDGAPGRGDGEARGVSPPDPDPKRPWTLVVDAIRKRVLPTDEAWVDLWRSEWSSPYRTQGRDLDPGSDVNGLYWRWAKAPEPRLPHEWRHPATDPAPRMLPQWATRPMIDSGPSNPPSATLSQNPNIPEGARMVVGSTAAQPKHRIVHAWHAKDGTLFTLGSDGRIWYFDCGVGWRMLDVYPPGLEP